MSHNLEQIINQILKMKFMDSKSSINSFKGLLFPQNVGIGFLLKKQGDQYFPELYSISKNRADHNRSLHQMYLSKSGEDSVSINSFGDRTQIALSLNQHHILFRIRNTEVEILTYNTPTDETVIDLLKVKEELKNHFSGISKKIRGFLET